MSGDAAMEGSPSQDKIGDLAVMVFIAGGMTLAFYDPPIGATGSLVPGISVAITFLAWCLYVVGDWLYRVVKSKRKAVDGSTESAEQTTAGIFTLPREG